jgi:hypothetical protein
MTYIVLDERATSPAIDSKVAVTLRAEITSVVNGASLGVSKMSSWESFKT